MAEEAVYTQFLRYIELHFVEDSITFRGAYNYKTWRIQLHIVEKGITLCE